MVGANGSHPIQTNGKEDRMQIDVTFDAARGHFIATAPELNQAVAALSMSVLKQQVARLVPNAELHLDRAAQQELDARRGKNR